MACSGQNIAFFYSSYNSHEINGAIGIHCLLRLSVSLGKQAHARQDCEMRDTVIGLRLASHKSLMQEALYTPLFPHTKQRLLKPPPLLPALLWNTLPPLGYAHPTLSAYCHAAYSSINSASSFSCFSTP